MTAFTVAQALAPALADEIRRQAPAVTITQSAVDGQGYVTLTTTPDVTSPQKAAIDAAQLTTVPRPPAGVICAYAAAAAPAGWLLCDGASYPQSAYPALFAVIGTTYGGNASNFNVPDLRGRIPIGLDATDSSMDAVGEVGGSKTHTHAGHAAHSNHAALAAHAHELPFTKLAGGTAALRMLAQSVFGSGTSRAPESVSAAPTANTTAAAVALSQAVSGGTPDAHSAHSAHDSPNHLPPFMALFYIIRT